MTLQVVKVHICGQQLHANCDDGRPPSLQVLKETVERGVGLQQDWFEFFDSNGSKLMTDGEIKAAIYEGRTPIYGAVSGHSVHHFEQRSEEFAQMQWKVMRDQFTVLSLQMGSTQQELKNLHEEVQAKDKENVRMLNVVKSQLADGLQVMGECESSWINVEELVKQLNDSVHDVEQKIGQESQKRQAAIQEVEFKIGRKNKAQQHDNARLQEAFDARVGLLQEADGQLRQDIHALHKKVEGLKDLANSHHEDSLKFLAEVRAIATHAIGDASSALLRQAHEDTAAQISGLANMITDFEARIARSETLATDTASRWLQTTEQLKDQYNSLSQAVDQYNLQVRTSSAKNQEIRDQLGMHADAVEAMSEAMKAEQERERKAREDQLHSMQQNLNGLLKSTFKELETNLVGLVDRETAARTAAIRQAIDDIGTVMEKEIPSQLRSEPTPLKTSTTSNIPTVDTNVTPRSGPSYESTCASPHTPPRYNSVVGYVPVAPAYPSIRIRSDRQTTPPARSATPPIAGSRLGHDVKRSASAQVIGSGAGPQVVVAVRR